MSLDDDVAVMARGQEVSRAREVLEEHCNERRSKIIAKILKQIRDPNSGPLEAELAIQAWLELSALESLRIDLERQVKDGEMAGKRISSN